MAARVAGSAGRRRWADGAMACREQPHVNSPIRAAERLDHVLQRALRRVLLWRKFAGSFTGGLLEPFHGPGWNRRESGVRETFLNVVQEPTDVLVYRRPPEHARPVPRRPGEACGDGAGVHRHELRERIAALVRGGARRHDPGPPALRPRAILAEPRGGALPLPDPRQARLHAHPRVPESGQRLERPEGVGRGRAEGGGRLPGRQGVEAGRRWSGSPATACG